MNNTVPVAIDPRIIWELALAVLLAGAIFSPAAITAAQAPAGSAGQPQPPPDLIAALKATPGVLGVEAAQTMSRKHVIFAWFENKQAS